MYDPKSEAKEFIADSTEDAVAKACSYFGRSEDDLTVRAYQTEEVSGLAGRVVVVAQPTESVGRVRSGGGEGRGRDRDRGERGDRGRGDRGDRGGRDRGGRGRDRDRDRDRGRGSEGEERRAAVPEAPSEPSVGTAKGEIGPIGEFFLGLVERMDLGPFELSAAEDEKFLIFQLTGSAAQGLTADGRTVDAVQLLANQLAMKLDPESKRVVLDVEGNRDKRDEFLARIADRAAKRAQDTGRAVALDAMNAKDRREIHVALREVEGVATMSMGEGRYRQVVVVPEGAPEYEEARASSSGSSRD